MSYRGTIIRESLADKSILDQVTIESTRIEDVTEKHATPWLQHWTLHVVTIPDDRAEAFAEAISKDLDYSNGTSWYADYKNPQYHYIIFKDKVFRIPRDSQEGYEEAKRYGLGLGIPEHQVDFSPDIN